jgi:hypothetical protein
MLKASADKMTNIWKIGDFPDIFEKLFQLSGIPTELLTQNIYSSLTLL